MIDSCGSVHYRLYWADSGLYAVKYVELQTGEVGTLYENIEQQSTFYGISIYNVSGRPSTSAMCLAFQNIRETNTIFWVKNKECQNMYIECPKV